MIEVTLFKISLTTKRGKNPNPKGIIGVDIHVIAENKGEAIELMWLLLDDYLKEDAIIQVIPVLHGYLNEKIPNNTTT